MWSNGLFLPYFLVCDELRKEHSTIVVREGTLKLIDERNEEALVEYPSVFSKTLRYR